jgi:shikimate dehydrogenase
MDATTPPARTFLSELTGSFSSPAADNPTVAMMEAAYRHHGLDTRYINCEVPPELLHDAVRGAWAMGWVGFNLSMPHKVTVIAYLDQLAESAKIVGAVNCVVRRGDQLVGENTDGQGFLASLRTVIDPAGKVIVIFGAGGAARAIAVEAALAGAGSITVLNRNRVRGQELAELINRNTPANASFVPWDEPYVVPADADIVVNATSIGMFPQLDDRLNLHLDSLLPRMVVADVIPNPPWTAFLTSARERGCTTIDGLGMLVNQGAINVKHWTGVDADPAVMRRTLAELFQSSD